MSYLRLAAAAGILALGAALYWLGYDHGIDNERRMQSEALSAALEEQRLQFAETMKRAADHLERQREVEVRFRTITKEVIRYVETHADAPDCLDDYGLYLWTSANRGETPHVPERDVGEMPRDAFRPEREVRP